MDTYDRRAGSFQAVWPPIGLAPERALGPVAASLFGGGGLNRVPACDPDLGGPDLAVGTRSPRAPRCRHHPKSSSMDPGSLGRRHRLAVNRSPAVFQLARNPLRMDRDRKGRRGSGPVPRCADARAPRGAGSGSPLGGDRPAVGPAYIRSPGQGIRAGSPGPGIGCSARVATNAVSEVLQGRGGGWGSAEGCPGKSATPHPPAPSKPQRGLPGRHQSRDYACSRSRNRTFVNACTVILD